MKQNKRNNCNSTQDFIAFAVIIYNERVLLLQDEDGDWSPPMLRIPPETDPEILIEEALSSDFKIDGYVVMPIATEIYTDKKQNNRSALGITYAYIADSDQVQIPPECARVYRWVPIRMLFDENIKTNFPLHEWTPFIELALIYHAANDDDEDMTEEELTEEIKKLESIIEEEVSNA